MFYTTREILEKYNIKDYTPKGTQKFINYMKQRGVELKLEIPASGRAQSKYSIIGEINQNNEIWKPYPLAPEWEFSDQGNVRNITTKKYYGHGQKTNDGYLKIDMGNGLSVRMHRGVLESFNPIENSQQYVVDHINGKRDDNRLENLRWVFQSENAKFADEYNTELKALVAQLIQKHGYNKTKEELLFLLNK